MPNTFYPVVSFKKLHDDVPTPSYAKQGDAGLDLCVTESVDLSPHESRMVGSGIAVAIPEGYVGIVVPRSSWGCKGLALKNTVGVIDSGYRGEVKMKLFNRNEIGDLHIERGERVAQLLVMPVASAIMVETAVLPESERADGGFGSTGTRYEGSRL